MANLSYVTEEGLKRLQQELDRLTKIERPKISQQIAEARDKGDLSENAHQVTNSVRLKSCIMFPPSSFLNDYHSPGG